MPSYPVSLFVPRTVANRVGVVYDALKTKVLFAEDFNNAAAEIVAIQETLGLNPEGAATTVGDRLGAIESDIADLSEDGGWRALATTPTRQSTDDPVFVLRFAADMTAILGQGMRIKITQNGTVRYLIVVLVGAYTGGNTDVTVYGGTDYDVNDTSTYPITNPFYSREKAPLGFPLSPAKWSVDVTDTTNRTQSSPTANTWYNPGGTSEQIVLPIGVWDVEYFAVLGLNAGSSTSWRLQSTLSTANNSESDNKFTCDVFANALTIFVQSVSRRNLVAVSVKTTFYLNIRTKNTGMSNISTNGTEAMTRIIAACVYL